MTIPADSDTVPPYQQEQMPVQADVAHIKEEKGDAKKSVDDDNIIQLSGLRHPPRNLELEAALIGAIMRDDRHIDQVSETLRPEHFYATQHKKLYSIILRIKEQGNTVTAQSLLHIFQNDQDISEIGGLNYLKELAATPLTFVSPSEVSKILYDLHCKRELITIGDKVIQDAYDQQDIEKTASVQIEQAEEMLYNLADKGLSDAGAVGLNDAVDKALRMAEKAFKRDGHIIGITSGFRDIDNMLGGLIPSDLIILAGRPGMGKTALATNIAYNAAKKSLDVKIDENGLEYSEGGRVLFFSLEMSHEQLAARIMGQVAQVSSDKMRRGKINDQEFDDVSNAAREIAKVPLFIDDTPALTITSLRQRARRMKRKENISMIILDYLQLLQGSAGSRSDNRVQEVSEITRGLKMIAKELNIPVIALSQLSRQVEAREDKRPQLADLRESGSIEQDADVVTFIYRAEYYLGREHPEKRGNESDEKFHERIDDYNKRVEESRNRAEVIIAKQRHGPTGIIELGFKGEYTQFMDLDYQYGEENI